MKPARELSYGPGAGYIREYSARGERPDSRALHGCPQLSLLLGRDERSSGVLVVLTTPGEGEWPTPRTLLAERWMEILPGEEGCIEIAIQALQTILGRIRGIGE